MKTSLINSKQIFFAVLIATQILLAAGVTHAQPYQTISTQDSSVGDNLIRTVTTVQSGNNQLNRFLMTQVRKAGPPDEAVKGAILLLPPLGSGYVCGRTRFRIRNVQYSAVNDVSKRDDQLQAGVWTRRLHVLD